MRCFKGKLSLLPVLLLTFCVQDIYGAGILSIKEKGFEEIQIKDHHINVKINNSYAKTEVIQSFYNPNKKDLEAVYSFPVPKDASMSEVKLYLGEKEINGEVIEKKEAKKIYEKEKSKGGDVALTEKNSFYDFKFNVYPIKANSEIKIRFVYYQALKIDTGIGTYIYPLEEGIKEGVGGFWGKNSKVEGNFTAKIDLKTSYPIENLRVKEYQSETNIKKLNEKNYVINLIAKDRNLDKDLVFYYKLKDNLPAKLELIPYKETKAKSGKFMLVLTPGLDLKPLDKGRDYIFLLDKSGSMTDSRMKKLREGVREALDKMTKKDRIKIISFNDYVKYEINAWTNEREKCMEKVNNIRTGGGTNIYAAIQAALKDLDKNRSSNIILITDGMANQGIINPREFHNLVKDYDLRIFAFLLGNQGNSSLMEMLCKSSGGVLSNISFRDDLVGKVLLAQNKLNYESLQNVDIKIEGVKIKNLTNQHIKKIYRGEQIVVFGEYENGGRANLKIKANLSGEDKVYELPFEFPNIEKSNPEIERLWAMAKIKEREYLKNIGIINKTKAKNEIKNIALKYQLVTDYTSMLVLSDKKFIEYNIKRTNEKRIKKENKAVYKRQTNKNTKYSKPARLARYQNTGRGKRTSNGEKKRYSWDGFDLDFGGGGGLGFGGGAIDPISAILALFGLGSTLLFGKKK